MTVIVPLGDSDETNAAESATIVMEQLILPAENTVGGDGPHANQSAVQMVDVVVPLDAEPGYKFLTIGARDVRIPLPGAGDRIEVAVPLYKLKPTVVIVPQRWTQQPYGSRRLQLHGKTFI